MLDRRSEAKKKAAKSISDAENDSQNKTQVNENPATGKKNDINLKPSKHQENNERSTGSTEKQSTRKNRTIDKKTNKLKLEDDNKSVETKDSDAETTENQQNKEVAEKPENKSEHSELMLSDYSSDEESDIISGRKIKKINGNTQEKEPKQTKNTEKRPASSNDGSNSEVDNKFSRKSPRARTKIKYVESESEEETTEPTSKKVLSVVQENQNLSDSSSKSSESESESNSSLSSGAPVSKRKKMPPKRKVIPVKPQKITNTSDAYKKDTRRRVDLSEMDAPEGKDSAVEKMKQRQFDGIVRYFLGGEGAKNVPIDPDLLKKKLEKKNNDKKNSEPSTSGTSKTEQTKPKQKQQDDSSSESEWEEVSDAGEPMDIEDYNPEIPKEGIEINISVPDPRRERRKKRQAQFADYARVFLNRFKKDTQVARHKVHLLGYVAHMLHINRILLDNVFQGLALSMLPDDFLGITTKKTNQILLTKMMTWFRNTFTLERQENKLGLVDNLMECLEKKIAPTSDTYCCLFVIFGRAMKLDVRLCKVAYPITFKAHNLIPTERQKKAQVKPESADMEQEGTEASESKPLKTKRENKKNKSKAADQPSTSKTRHSDKKNHKTCKSKPGRSKRTKLTSLSEGDEDDEKSDKKVRKKRQVSKQNMSYKEDKSEEDSESDEDFEPEKKYTGRKSPSTSSKKNRKILSSESEEEENNKMDGRPCVDTWAEVFLNSEGKWVCVDVVENIMNRPYEIEANASRKISYVLTVDNESKIKDVTQRYASGWLTEVRKLRVDYEWWEESLAPYAPAQIKREKDENQQLNDMLCNKPMPTTIGEFKSHPLYVLKRHLLKYEGLYPPDAPPLGFIRKEPVYARECVRTLHTRETWKREGKAIKLGEEPYKLVKARPRWDKVNKKIYTPEEPMDVYGEWQTEPWVSAPCKDGKVPRNDYGNVELFKPSMLPEGAVHLRLPGLNRVARKLGIDCAPAMVGFDGSASIGVIPVFDGFVACEEYEEVLIAAWNEEQVNIAAREKEKYEKRVYGNWRKLIRGLLIREKIKLRYFTDKERDVDSEKKKK